MIAPQRKSLPHAIPVWVNPHEEIYFISINCKDRGRNQLAKLEISGALFETVRHRQERRLWWPHVFLLMPDHLHSLVSFPPSGTRIQTVISKWKEWTAKQFQVSWQRDFFEHRLRQEESRREKAAYIMENPVRRGLVKKSRRLAFRVFRRWAAAPI
jgi:REP element-mobilizing transposase RayT